MTFLHKMAKKSNTFYFQNLFICSAFQASWILAVLKPVAKICPFIPIYTYFMTFMHNKRDEVTRIVSLYVFYFVLFFNKHM